MKSSQYFNLFALFLLAFPWQGSTQSMALSAIGASGGTTTNSSGHSLTWTVGEAVTMNAVQGDLYLGAGFQQARKRSTTVGVFCVFVPAFAIKAYPNPAGELLTIEAPEGDISLSLCDLLGRQVITHHRMNGKGQLNLGQLPTGIYVLQVFDEKGRLAATTKIQHLENK